MKKLSNIIIILTLAIGMGACASSQNKKDATIEVEGTILELGMSTFQYGTHTLDGEDGFFALKSSKVDLNEYVGQEVQVEALMVEGYPVDGGPKFLEVISVKK